MAWISTLEGNKVKGEDGETIGTLHTDGTVTESDGTVIGFRKGDGSVIRTSASGLPLRSVVTSRSSLDGTKVRKADGRVVGHLQDDAKQNRS